MSLFFNIKAPLSIILLLSLIFFAGCKKKNNDSQNSLPEIKDLEIVSFTSSSAICSANVSSEGSGALTEVGICWGTNAEPTVNSSSKKSSSSLGVFSLEITGLNPATVYHVRAYATNEHGTAYSNEKILTTAANPTNLHLGKYNHLNGMGAYFEFFAGNVVRYGGTAGYTEGSYTMLSTTKVKVEIGSWGEGDFTNNFQTLTIAGNVFSK